MLSDNSSNASIGDGVVDGDDDDDSNVMPHNMMTVALEMAVARNRRPSDVTSDIFDESLRYNMNVLSNHNVSYI
jgi:hypothetical protein